MTTDPEYISEMATVRFMVNDYQGMEAFLYYLYARSILMIQSGMSSYEIEKFVNMVIPIKSMHFQKQRVMKSEEEDAKLQELKADLSDVEKAALQKFEDNLRSLSEEEWEIVVGRSGFVGWDILLPLLEKEVQEQVAVYMNPSYTFVYEHALWEVNAYRIPEKYKGMYKRGEDNYKKPVPISIDKALICFIKEDIEDYAKRGQLSSYSPFWIFGTKQYQKNLEYIFTRKQIIEAHSVRILNLAMKEKADKEREWSQNYV